MINDFLLELSDLLEKYNYSIVAEPALSGTAIINIKSVSVYPRLETLYTDIDVIDKDSISRYFESELKWEPNSEPAGTVKFLGKDIAVFHKSGWLAMNKNGSVFYFVDEPTVHNAIHDSPQGSSYYLGTMVGVKKPDAWKTSAMYFNLSENENETVQQRKIHWT